MDTFWLWLHFSQKVKNYTEFESKMRYFYCFAKKILLKIFYKNVLQQSQHNLTQLNIHFLSKILKEYEQEEIRWWYIIKFCHLLSHILSVRSTEIFPDNQSMKIGKKHSLCFVMNLTWSIYKPMQKQQITK